MAESEEVDNVVETLAKKYGRSGSGRGAVLRMLGAYLIYKAQGGAGLRSIGFSRASINYYLEKLQDAGLMGEQ